MTSPGAHGEGEGVVVLWKYRDSHVFRRSQPRSYRYGIDEEFKALPAAAFDALVASRKDAEESVEAMTHVLSERIAEMAANAALLARANTAKVAADLMRARAERAERFLSMLFDSHWDGTIGHPPTWRLRGDFRHILAGLRGETLLDAIRDMLSRLDDAMGGA